MARKTVVGRQPDDVPTLADHDLGIEGQPPCDLDAQLRRADGLPDHEGARGADVDGIQVLQLSSEGRRSKGPVPADVEASQKDDECHGCASCL
jgi:hypothetical protein